MRDCVLVITPLKLARHSEVRNFLYSLINELAVGVSPAPAAVYLSEAVMNALCPLVLEDVAEGKREPVKNLVVISDGVAPVRHKGAYRVILRGLENLAAEVKLPELPVHPFSDSGRYRSALVLIARYGACADTETNA